MKKNVAGQSIGCQMITAADGTAFTGAVSVSITKDNGTQAAGGTVTHEGNGYHSYAPTQAETNADHIAFTFTGTGAIPTTTQIYTNFPQTADHTAAIADIPTNSELNARTITSASYATASNLATVDTVVDAILVDTNELQTNQGNWLTATGFSTFNPATDTVATVTTVTNLTSLPATPANWITAAGIAANALNGKGDWNTTAPDNAGITANGVAIGALNNITAAQVWTHATRSLTTEVNVNITKINGVAVQGNGTPANLWRA